MELLIVFDTPENGNRHSPSRLQSSWHGGLGAENHSTGTELHASSHCKKGTGGTASHSTAADAGSHNPQETGQAARLSLREKRESSTSGAGEREQRLPRPQDHCAGLFQAVTSRIKHILIAQRACVCIFRCWFTACLPILLWNLKDHTVKN